jgi:hypothetical protein
LKKSNGEKNQIKFLKNRPIWFYKPKIKKTESNRTQTEKTKKMSQTRKNRAKTKPN